MTFFKNLLIPNITLPKQQWAFEKRHKTLLILLSAVSIILFFFAIFRYIQGNMYMAYADIFGVAILIVLLIFLKRSIHNYTSISRLFILSTLLLSMTNLIYSDHHSRIIWLISIMITSYYFRGKKEGTFWSGFIIVGLTINQIFNNNSSLLGIDYFAIVINFIFISLSLSWYEELKEYRKSQLLQEIKKKEEVAKQLKLLASIDSMTKLYNRRFFLEISEQSLALSKREKYNLCTLIIDIDKFKNVNDTYGHKIGDDVIIALSNTLLKLTRKSDIVGRWGGEEFVMHLPQTDLNGASEMAEKIRLEIENLLISVENDKEIRFTVSIGLSAVNIKNDKNIEESIIRADKALYEAKENGRNRVCCY